MSHPASKNRSGYPLIPQNSICACAMFSLFFFTACFPSAHAQVTFEGDSTLVNIRIVHEGKPVAGAEVRRVLPWSRFHEGMESKGVIIGSTGSRGIISLPLRVKYGRIREGGGVIAMIPGKLAGFTNISIFADPDSITVRLHPVRTVSGLVADSTGKPLPGAEVIVSNLIGDGDSEYANMNHIGGAPGYSATSDARG